MGLIDTHSHLYVKEFDDDRDAVVERALASGVDKIFLPNINAGTVEPMLGLCRRYEGRLYPMLGLHPTDLEPDHGQVLDGMERLLQAPHPYIGIGEVGLDYYWSQSYYAEQQEAFHRQIGWAERYGLPLMVHARAAHKELVDVMRAHKSKGLRGVFHCFSGTADEAEELLAFDGFMLGIGGVLTYKKSVLPATLRSVPLARIVLETDAPYLAPVPHRGRRNESAYLHHVAEALSAIYGVTVDEVARATSANAIEVFGRAR